MREALAESLAGSRKTVTVTIEASARACVNCQYYEQYYRQNRGNVAGWVPTATGYCLFYQCRRGALRQPCKEFLKYPVKQKAPLSLETKVMEDRKDQG